MADNLPRLDVRNVAGLLRRRALAIGALVGITFVVVYGLIVDATIHITNQYREQRTVLGHDRETSLRLTYRHVLPSVFANSVILTLGFLVLTASPFSMNADFGLLAAIAIMVGFAFDVLCLPLLLYVCDPLISRSSRPVLAAPVVPAQS